MTKKEILKNRLVMADQNVLCYSLTQEMTAARPGYEKEWAAAKEEADTIREMIDELVSGDPGNESVTIRGTIDRWYTGQGKAGGEPSLRFLKVRDRDGNRRILEVGCDAGKDLLRRCDPERCERMVFHIDENGLVSNWEWAGAAGENSKECAN